MKISQPVSASFILLSCSRFAADSAEASPFGFLLFWGDVVTRFTAVGTTTLLARLLALIVVAIKAAPR